MKIFWIVISSYLLSPSSCNLVDVAIAYHMDEFDQSATDQFKNEFIKKFAIDTLAAKQNSTQMALVLGRSDGQTRVACQLSNSSSKFERVNVTSYFLSTGNQKIDVNYDTDAILERVNESVFNGRRSQSGDRMEAPNFLILFTQSNSSSNEVLRTELTKADAVVIWYKNGATFNFEYGDRMNNGSRYFTSILDVVAELKKSLNNSLEQCEYEAIWRNCSTTITRCPCVREVGFKFKRVSNKNMCPENASDVPCNVKEPCQIQLVWGPMPSHYVALMIWLIVVSIPLACWPFCWCCFALLVRKYIPLLIEYIIDEGDQLAREGVKAAVGKLKQQSPAVGEEETTTNEKSELKSGVSGISRVKSEAAASSVSLAASSKKSIAALDGKSAVKVEAVVETGEALNKSALSARLSQKKDTSGADRPTLLQRLKQARLEKGASMLKQEEPVEEPKEADRGGLLQRLKAARLAKGAPMLKQAQEEEAEESEPKEVDREGLLKRLKAARLAKGGVVLSKKSSSKSNSVNRAALLKRLKAGKK